MAVLGFKRKKRRKYAIKRDEFGRSARTRCFEMFENDIHLSEIADAVDLKIESVYKYHQQWKKNPDFEKQYEYFRRLLDKRGPDRERTLELVANLGGIDKTEIETLLQKPHGLRRLMMGKIYFPGKSDADHKRYLALEIAMLISTHISEKGGLEDVHYALEQLINEHKKDRERKEKQIEQDNKRIEFLRHIIQADVEKEQRRRARPERLSPEQIDRIIEWRVQSTIKQTEVMYWMKIGDLMAKGLSKEQAREKFYRDLIDKGDQKGAEMIREFQNTVHPVETGNQKRLPPSDKTHRDG